MKSKNTAFIIILSITIFMTSFLCIFGKKSGIKGTVVKISGNQMPSPDRPPAAPVGIRATICIYEPTSLNQVTRVGESAMYSAIQTRQIAQTESNSKGEFKVKLAPGKYSVFIKTDKGFYANSFDGQNNINPVEVIKKKMSKVELRYDYGAAY